MHLGIASCWLSNLELMWVEFVISPVFCRQRFFLRVLQFSSLPKSQQLDLSRAAGHSLIPAINVNVTIYNQTAIKKWLYGLKVEVSTNKIDAVILILNYWAVYTQWLYILIYSYVLAPCLILKYSYFNRQYIFNILD